MALDNMNIIYTMNYEKTHIHIVKILWVDNSQPKEKLRTKEWLLKISEFIDFEKSSSFQESPTPLEVEEKEEEKKSS